MPKNSHFGSSAGGVEWHKGLDSDSLWKSNIFVLIKASRLFPWNVMYTKKKIRFLRKKAKQL